MADIKKTLPADNFRKYRKKNNPNDACFLVSSCSLKKASQCDQTHMKVPMLIGQMPFRGK